MSYPTLSRTGMLSAMALFLLGGMAQGQLPCCPINRAQRASLEGTAAPALTLSDLRGQEVTLSDLKGTVTVVNFWKGGLLDADGQLPDLRDLQARYGEGRLRVVAIAMNEKAASAAREWLGQQEVQCEVLRGDDEVGKQCSLTALPTTLVIDAKGIVARQYSGKVPIRQLEAQVGALLPG